MALNPSSALAQRRIKGIEALAIQLLLHNAQSLGKALVVHNFPFAQVTQYVNRIWVVSQQQQVFIGGTGLLLGRQVFSCRSVIGSPFTPSAAAVKGKPAAACG